MTTPEVAKPGLHLERAMAAVAFLCVGAYMSADLALSWRAYEQQVIPHESLLRQVDESIKLDAAALVAAYRAPVPASAAATAMLRATRQYDEAAVLGAIDEIKASSTQPIDSEAFTVGAKRLMYAHQIQRQFYRHQLRQAYAQFEGRAPVLGRFISYAYVTYKALEERYTQ